MIRATVVRLGTRVGFALALAMPGAAAAQTTLAVLHQFAGEGFAAPDDALVVTPDGTVYAAASAGGPYGCGGIFRVSPGALPAMVHAFAARSSPETRPTLMRASDGTFYGTAPDAAGRGTVFRMTAAGQVTTLHTFTTTAGGVAPTGTLVEAPDGTFYGTTRLGGAWLHGTIYRITAAGAVTIVHAFPGPAVPQSASYPEAGLVRAGDGNYYGTTSQGGNGGGTVFRLTPAGDVAYIAQLGGGQGPMYPYTPLAAGADGALYGTSAGGPSGSTVYRVTPAGEVTVVHAFGQAIGLTGPSGLTASPDGGFYGTSAWKPGDTDTFTGMVFTVKPDGTFAVVHAFSTEPGTGWRPATATPVLGGDGTLYGLTSLGGRGGYPGTVFRLAPGGTIAFVPMPPASGGVIPSTTLQRGADGNLYGTTDRGGPADAGTIYRVSPTGTPVAVVLGLPGVVANGSAPQELLAAADGSLYGTVTYGGASGAGALFAMTPAGDATIRHAFDGEIRYPNGPLVQVADGTIYGTAAGRTPHEGVVFSMTPQGVVSERYRYDVTEPGLAAARMSGLVEAPDGNLYGILVDADPGAIFRITPGGSFTIVHRFGGAPLDGRRPLARLVRGVDGQLYGTTAYGGASDQGAAFRLALDGTVTLLASFSTATDVGGVPAAPLIQASDGQFYGVASGGASGGAGSLFRMSPAGVVTLVQPLPWSPIQFVDGQPRASAGATQGADGTLYVPSPTGGVFGLGALYRIGAPLPALDDGDGDGLPGDWETRFGLSPAAATGIDGADGDPDGDGVTNAQELASGSHPRGVVVSHLAEGATGTFFDTRIALANPTAIPAHVLCRFQTERGDVFSDYRTLAPHSRVTLDAGTWPFLADASFSSIVEADVDVVVDRTMTWGAGGYGSHAERGWRGAPSTAWYFAEGATHGAFDLFYLLHNPGAVTAEIDITYLRPAPRPPVARHYAVAPHSRLTIRVDDVPGLSETDTSAVVRSANGVPILAERSMYLSRPDAVYAGGHASAGVAAPATRWLLAEGATGTFFDMYVLVANPGAQATTVRFDYLLAGGGVIAREHTVAAASRVTVDPAFEAPELAGASFSTIVTSADGAPIVVERSMWWPAGGAGWQEAHDSTGATGSAIRWAMAEGESGGPSQTRTYVLIANTSTFGGSARVTLLFEDGSTAERTFALHAASRLTVDVGAAFVESIDRRYGAVVESLGDTPAAIVVERAMYSNANGILWAAGTGSLATPLP